MDYWAKDNYSWGRSLSTQLNCNSKNGSDVVNFLSTQWSTDGSRSSEPHTPWALSAKANILCEVHCLVCRLQTWHHLTILVRGRQRAVCDNQHRAKCPGAWLVLDSTWSTERGRQGPPVVPAGWCHPPHLKRIIGMATAAFPWPTDQPQVWPAVVAAFTGLEPPRFLYVGIP